MSLVEAIKIDVCRRLREESLVRIEKCLSEISEEELWIRPNQHLNGIGNLILHLCGNARQWIVSGLGGQPDTRERDREFEARGGYTKADLLDLARASLDEVEATLTPLEEADLVKVYPIQAFEETGIAVLFHVVEHFSYHVGQITWYVKTLREKDLGYYSGLDLHKKGQ